MVADAAVAATDGISGVMNKVSVFIATAESAAADGLTWSEFGQLLIALLRLIVAAIDDVTSLTGDQKKSLALEAVGWLFDCVADRAVPFYIKPFWFLVRSAVRSLVLAIASGSIEQLLPLVRSATT